MTNEDIQRAKEWCDKIEKLSDNLSADKEFTSSIPTIRTCLNKALEPVVANNASTQNEAIDILSNALELNYGDNLIGREDYNIANRYLNQPDYKAIAEEMRKTLLLCKKDYEGIKRACKKYGFEKTFKDCGESIEYINNVIAKWEEMKK